MSHTADPMLEEHAKRLNTMAWKQYAYAGSDVAVPDQVIVLVKIFLDCMT